MIAELFELFGRRQQQLLDEMHEPAPNYRLSDVHCALGLTQLRKLDRFVARRRELADRYDRMLTGLAPWLKPVPRVPNCDAGLHLYAVLIDFVALGLDRAAAMRRLHDQGIATQVHYIPLPQQPYYRERGWRVEDFPGARAYYERVLSLPLFPAMTAADVERVVTALREVLRP